MRLAVLSDIHAHFPALLATAAHIDAWKPDIVVVNGDTINRGPSPAECWRYVSQRSREDNWQLLLGNHEQYVLAHTQPGALENHVMSSWTYRLMAADVGSLANLPEQWESQSHGNVRVRHGSMQGIVTGIYPETSDEELQQLIAPAPALFVGGHTHRPLIRRIDQTLVVNAGSSGTPCDGDLRASYARLEWRGSDWRASIVRVPYNRQQTKRDYFDSGMLEQVGPVAQLIYHEWRHGQPYILDWMTTFREPIARGDIAEDAAISLFLQQRGLAI